MIGVIVPVYKTERYVAECIESILSQTYTRFRLILVDDGSPDGAGAICDEYAKRDSRITVVHQENAGVTRARARGVQEATDCEYITFVDSDDVLPPTAFSTLRNAMGEHCDISIGGMLYFHKSNDLKKHHCPTNKKAQREIITSTKFRNNTVEGSDSNLWAKLIRRYLIDAHTFDVPREIIVGEDTIANTRIAFKNCKNVAISTACVYYYRQHPDSCMHTFKNSLHDEERLVKYIWDSVPADEKAKHYNSYIKRRINSFDYNFGYATETPEWFGSDFHKELLADIKKYRYRKLPLERMLLVARGKTLRKLLIKLKSIKNSISRQIGQ